MSAHHPHASALGSQPPARSLIQSVLHGSQISYRNTLRAHACFPTGVTATRTRRALFVQYGNYTRHGGASPASARDERERLRLEGDKACCTRGWLRMVHSAKNLWAAFLEIGSELCDQTSLLTATLATYLIPVPRGE